MSDRARPSLRVPIAALAEGDRSLAPRELHYLTRVHRLRAGDRFVAFDPQRAVEGEGEILEVVGPDAKVRIGAVTPAAQVAARAITWIQALPKGEKMDAIVRDATELGVTRIVPVTSTFTVVKLEGPKREARRQRWARIAEEAARQCGRSDAPEVLPLASWDQALSAIAGEPEVPAAFCLYEKATVPIGPLLLSVAGSASSFVFASGSEGGFSAEEVARAGELGFAVVALGHFTLRAETVAAATLGALHAVTAIASFTP